MASKVVWGLLRRSRIISKAFWPRFSLFAENILFKKLRRFSSDFFSVFITCCPSNLKVLLRYVSLFFGNSILEVWKGFTYFEACNASWADKLMILSKQWFGKQKLIFPCIVIHIRLHSFIVLGYQKARRKWIPFRGWTWDHLLHPKVRKSLFFTYLLAIYILRKLFFLVSSNFDLHLFSTYRVVKLDLTYLLQGTISQWPILFCHTVRIMLVHLYNKSSNLCVCVSHPVSPEPLDLWSYKIACVMYSSYERFLRKKFL